MKEICPSCGHLFKAGYGYTECEGCREVDIEEEEEILEAKREELLKRNKEFVSFPSPNLDKLSNAELEKRADLLEATFDDLFESEDSDSPADEGGDSHGSA